MAAKAAASSCPYGKGGRFGKHHKINGLRSHRFPYGDFGCFGHRDPRREVGTDIVVPDRKLNQLVGQSKLRSQLLEIAVSSFVLSCSITLVELEFSSLICCLEPIGTSPQVAANVPHGSPRFVTHGVLTDEGC